MRARTLLSLFAVSLAILGCESTSPPPKAQDSLSKSLPKGTTLPDSFASRLSVEVQPLQAKWVTTFRDPRLEAIVDEALRNNLNLRSASLQVESAAGLITQASSQMKPVIAAAGEGTQQSFGSSTSSNALQGALSVSWELDIWGRIRAETAAAEAQYEASVADYEYARLSLKANAAKSWFLAVETNLQLAFAKEVVGLYEKTLDIVSTKYEFGDVGMREVHLARADLASAKERLRQVDGANQIALRSLEILLGRYPSAELEVSRDFVAVPPPVPVGLPSELIERRPDLIAAERRVAAAFDLTQSARAARLPSIGLTGAAGGVNSQLTDLLGTGDQFWSLGANFLAPLFTGGALEAQVEISTAQQEAALAAFGQRALVALGEVETALSNESLLREREELLQSVMDDNRNAFELAQAQFEAGSIELLDVLQMQARFVNSKVALINMRNARLAERINLHLSLGGDFDAARY